MNNEVVKRATLAEKDKIVTFLNANWGALHPLVNNNLFFDYYYLDGENINFYYLEENFEIVAICGYIKCSCETPSDLWVSIWCAKKGKNGLGLALMGEMQERTGAKVIACNNIRENTMPFYSFLGYYPDKLQHYYRLKNLEKYEIAIVTTKNISTCKKHENVSLKAFSDSLSVSKAFDVPCTAKPKKDLWYINKRYFDCPFYSYKVFGIYNDNACVSLVIFRVNKGIEGNALRLVDYIGKPCDFKLLSGYIDQLMADFDCEYCDMYSFGVDGSSAGFTLRDKDDKNIIPNYLNPLLQENTEYFFFTTDKENFMMFKADGDQDRKDIKL